MTSFRYKNLSFSAQLDWRHGGVFWNHSLSEANWRGLSIETLDREQDVVIDGKKGHWEGTDPVKIILSPLGSLRTDLQLFDQGHTRVYTSSGQQYPGTTIQLDPQDFIAQVLNDLYKHGLNSVLIEGGRSILDAFLDTGTWNEIHEIIGQKDWKTGVKAPSLSMKPATQIKLNGDQINVYKNEF